MIPARLLPMLVVRDAGLVGTGAVDAVLSGKDIHETSLGSRFHETTIGRIHETATE